MTSAEFLIAVEHVVAAFPFGEASAAKRGRSSTFPYVPVIDYGPQTTGVHRTRTKQLRGVAFKSRQDALDYAVAFIARARDNFREQLCTSRLRALREQHGLPREVPEGATR